MEHYFFIDVIINNVMKHRVGVLYLGTTRRTPSSGGCSGTPPKNMSLLHL